MASQGAPLVLDTELPYVLSVDQAASHLTTTATLTKVPSVHPRTGYAGAVVLVDSELLAVNAFTAHYLTISATGLFGTAVKTHLATAHVYEVVSVEHKADGLLVGYVLADGTIGYQRIVTSGEAVTLPPSGPVGSALVIGEDGETIFESLALSWAAPANLTDSTTGVVSVTSPPTLIAVRTDTVANAAADIIKNFATLNAHVNAIVSALNSGTAIPAD